MLNTTQVAQLVGLTRGRVIQLIHAGVLKATKWGRDYQIKPEDFANFKRLRDAYKYGIVPTQPTATRPLPPPAPVPTKK